MNSMELPQFITEKVRVSKDNEDVIQKYSLVLEKVLKSKKYVDDECSIVLPNDTAIAKEVHTLVKKMVSKDLKFIVVIGIGGSYLGTKAIYDALRGELDSYSSQSPKIIFIDTLSAPKLLALKHIFEHKVTNKKEFLVNLVSKSGTTLESIANFEALISALEGIHGDVSERVVVTTDKNSKLWKSASQKKYATLSIPARVGGRFSVFSPVGLFPLAALGIDIDALCSGATDIMKKNYAPQSALRIKYEFDHGCTINNLFLFNPELESLGKWYRQLLAESIGKECDREGKKVNAGILPIVSIGSNDLHSMGQLYFGGPKNIYTTFVYAKQLPTQIRVPTTQKFPELIEHISEKSFKKIMGALYEGVKAAYTSHQLAFSEIVLPAINEYTLGSFMQWKMLEIMYLGALFNVNAFDQPAVEAYKKETRTRLQSPQ